MKIRIRLSKQNQDSYLSLDSEVTNVNVPLPIGLVEKERVEQFVKDVCEAVCLIENGYRKKIRESVAVDKARVNKDKVTLDWLEEQIGIIRMGLNEQYERLENLEKK